MYLQRNIPYCRNRMGWWLWFPLQMCGCCHREIPMFSTVSLLIKHSYACLEFIISLSNDPFNIISLLLEFADGRLCVIYLWCMCIFALVIHRYKKIFSFEPFCQFNLPNKSFTLININFFNRTRWKKSLNRILMKNDKWLHFWKHFLLEVLAKTK